MAGNSERRGATRKVGSKKGPTVGSGGQRRRGLEPKKPTPKAEDRAKHPASKRGAKAAAAKPTAPARGPASRSGARPSGKPDANEQVYGRNSVVEALRAGVPATVLHVQTELALDERIREAIDLTKTLNIPLLEVTRFELDRMTNRGVHQGISLTVPPYRYADPSAFVAELDDPAATPLFVALDGITDPRNLGAVVRSAAAFGAHGVLIPERRAAGMTAAAWKTAAGAAARVPVARVTNLTRTLTAFHDAGAVIIGLAGEGPTSLGAIAAANLTGPVVVVVGSEGDGLGRLVARSCDLLVSIPIAADTESLNASVAAGIALYEVDRVRRLGE